MLDKTFLYCITEWGMIYIWVMLMQVYYAAYNTVDAFAL